MLRYARLAKKISGDGARHEPDTSARLGDIMMVGDAVPLSDDEIARLVELYQTAFGGEWFLSHDGSKVHTISAGVVVASIYRRDTSPATFGANGTLIILSHNSLMRMICEIRVSRASAAEGKFVSGISNEMHEIVSRFGNSAHRLGSRDASKGDPYIQNMQARAVLEQGIAALEAEVRRLQSMVAELPASQDRADAL
jgi:hypothetical protein